MSNLLDGRPAEPFSCRVSSAALAVLLVVCLGGGGLLSDYARVSGAHQALDRLAGDAARVTLASPSPIGRVSRCRSLFEAEVWTDLEVVVDDIEVTISSEGKSQQAVVSYDATVKLIAGRFIGLNEISISGEGEASQPERQPEREPDQRGLVAALDQRG